MGLKEFKTLIEKEFGKGLLFNPLENQGILSLKRFSTGSLVMDIDSGGGWPEGKVIEIFGPESSGKTFLINQAISTITNRKTNNQVLLIDEEGAFDANWVEAIGANMANIQIVRSQFAEQAMDILEIAVQSGNFALVALDSIAALIPKTELDQSTEKSHMALTARLMGTACRKIYRALNTSSQKGSNTTVFLINQIRMKVGLVFGNPETTPGGNAVKFAASIRVMLRSSEHTKDDYEQVTGKETKYTFLKNKTAPPLRVGLLNFNVGGKDKGKISNLHALIPLGIKIGKVIKTKGNYLSGEWFTEGEVEKKVHGINQAVTYFKTKSLTDLNKMLKDIEEDFLDGEVLAFKFKQSDLD